MTEVHVNRTPLEPEREVVHVHHHDVDGSEVVHVDDGADSSTAAGISFIAVLIVLVVLIALLALMFYVLPYTLGSNNVNVNIRTP
jgi:hypothetical protein